MKTRMKPRLLDGPAKTMRELRESCGLSQRDAGVEIGLLAPRKHAYTQAWVSKMEREGEPDIRIRRAIAVAYHVGPSRINALMDSPARPS